MPETKTTKEFLDKNDLNSYHAFVRRAVSDNKENIKKVKETVDKIPETYVTKQQLHDELYGILETEY